MHNKDIERIHSELISHIASVIKNARKAKGLKQCNFTEFGYSQRMWQKLESGRNEPTLKTLIKLSIILGISLSDFFELDHKKKNL